MNKEVSPLVIPGAWIKIGTGYGLHGLYAVVCQIYNEDSIEAVYLDDRNRAINDDLSWTGECWEFKNKGVSGGYADRYTRLKEFVSILRAGRL